MKLFTVVLLTVLIGALSYFVAFYGIQGVLRQHFAESFPHVQGTVLTSTVRTSRGSKGRIYYHPGISYRYTVNGLEFTGYRYRYDGHPNDSASAYAIMNSHPPGSAVDVYYNPADTTDAVLSPGVDKLDMMLSFFIAGAILFLWLIPLKSAQQPDLPWTGPAETGGVKVITEMMVTRLRLPRYPPLTVTLVTTGILMFSPAAVIGLGLLPTPPWETGEWALAIVFISGAVVYAWQHIDVHSGRRDLVIDEGARTVQFPSTYGRREQVPVSISQVRSVLLDKVRHQRKGGAYYTYMVTLEMADDSQQKLIDLNMARAEALGAWLRQKLGLSKQSFEPVENEPL
jgi:hypothetical protein